MRTPIATALMIVYGLFGQVDREADLKNSLASSLMSLQSRDAKQPTDTLTTRILAVPEAMHQPRRSTLSTFARDMAGILAGRDLKRVNAVQLAEDIAGALRSAGMGSSMFKEHVARFEKTLSEIGVNASASRTLASKLRAAGEEARGPQDLPVIR